MRLLGVELTRLRWRRAVLVLAVAALVLPALIWAGMVWDTRPVGDEELRNAEQQLTLERENLAQQVEDCAQNPDEWGVDPDASDPEEQCRQMMGEPELSWFLTRTPLDVETARDAGTGVAVLLLGLALIMGATYAGADWSSGSMSNQLLFEPRRIRVWVAKAGAIFLGGLATALLGMALFWGLTGATVAARDVEFGGAWRDLLEIGGRTALVAGLAGVGGFALTMLMRSTVGTLGLLLAVSIGGSLLVSALPIDGSGRWLLPYNVFGILQDGYAYEDYTIPACATGGFGEVCSQTLTMGEGVRFLGTLLVVGVTLSVASFRRRDVG